MINNNFLMKIISQRNCILKLKFLRPTKENFIFENFFFHIFIVIDHDQLFVAINCDEHLKYQTYTFAFCVRMVVDSVGIHVSHHFLIQSSKKLVTFTFGFFNGSFV